MKTVLLVDDAPFMAAVYQSIFEGTIYHIIGIAESAVQALELVKHRSPDLIIMDMVLPDHNGIEATKMLREQGCQSIIVAATSLDSSKVVSDCRDIGIEIILKKPLAKKQVLNELKDIFDGYAEVVNG